MSSSECRNELTALTVNFRATEAALSSVQLESAKSLKDFVEAALPAIEQGGLIGGEPLPFGSAPTADKNNVIVNLPNNLEFYAKELPILLLCDMTVATGALIRPLTMSGDEDGYSPYKGDFFLGALHGLRTDTMPKFPEASKAYREGLAWIALSRVDHKLSPAWFKMKPKGISLKTLRVAWKSMPRAYVTLQTLLPRLPKYTNSDNLHTWIKPSKAYQVPKLAFEKRGLLLSEEKEFLRERELAVNEKITAYNAYLKPENLAKDGIPQAAFEKVVAERNKLLDRVEPICARRASALYSGPSNKKGKRKGNRTVRALIQDLDFDTKFFTFGPWSILGVAAPILQENFFDKRGNPNLAAIALSVRQEYVELGGTTYKAILDWVNSSLV